jgi:hypothetical protein
MPGDLDAQNINRLTVWPLNLRLVFPDDWLTVNGFSPCRQILTAMIRLARVTEVSFSRMTVKRVSSRRGCVDGDRILV